MQWINVEVSRELEEALETDDVSKVKRRLEEGLAPNSVDLATQWSLLATAAKAGSSKVVDELLSRGAIAEIGETSALVAAIETDQSAIVRRLLEAGADVGADVAFHDEIFLPVVAAPTYAGLDVMRQVYTAMGIERVAMVWWEDALKAALKRRGVGHLRIVVEAVTPRLAVEGAADLEATTLKAAAKKLRAAARRQKGAHEQTALAGLADGLRAAIDRELIEYEETYDLVVSESWEVLQRRLEKTPQERRMTVAGLQLVLALGHKKVEYAAELLKKNPDPNVPEQDGTTALMNAAFWRNLPAVERLLEVGADPRARQPEKPSMSVIDRARSGGHPQIIDLLTKRLGLDEAADKKLAKLDGADLRKEANRLAAMAASEERWHRVEALLAHGATFDACAEDGRTLLMHAILNGDQDRVRWLVEHGANLEARCAQGRPIDSYARESDNKRPHRVAVFGKPEPETWMVDLIEELRAKG